MPQRDVSGIDRPAAYDRRSPALIAAGGRNIEGHALGKGQFGPVIYRARHAPHITLPRIGSRLAAAAGFLLPAERATDLGAGWSHIDVGDAAVGPPPRQKQL